MLKIKPLLLLVSIAILLLASCRTGSSEYDRMVAFGEKYTAAWNSKIPANMASFYAEDGSLVVNKGAPSVGREQLAGTSGSYMDAFPDMKLKMDSLVADGDTYRYHWTFTGTNTGPGGTGNKVVFSGFERWTMNGEGLIQMSVGTYDADDYNRQLRGDKP
jgi:ketosteroid isomerase-like protein